MPLRNPIVTRRHRRLRDDLGVQVSAVEGYLATRAARPAGDKGPIVFFNASTRIHTLSLNAAFSLLGAWAVRAAGEDVRYWICQAAMDPCVLGTSRRSPAKAPPCEPCQALSRVLYPPDRAIPLGIDQPGSRNLRRELERLPLERLVAWEEEGVPLGRLVLPSVRWVLRRHHLQDSAATRDLFAGYLSSAVSLGRVFRHWLSQLRPRVLVLFNGVFYPEALARHLAGAMGIRTVTHEVGLRPASAFFSHQEATFRSLPVHDSFRLTHEQESRLDEELARRFRGEFTMAGIRFWPEMAGLPSKVTALRPHFRQQVAVFPNVVFDTSQVHANVIFEDMFAWLDRLVTSFRNAPDTLFVIRAHPDEQRRGKESQETVAAWVRESRVDALDNVVFLHPGEPASSYELIRGSKFVLFYNSSVGLEASILGVPALSAGRARFTQMKTCFLPGSLGEYEHLLREFLEAADVSVPPDQVRRARAFLYVELFHASLDLGEFLVPDSDRPGMVRLSDFDPSRLIDSDSCRVIRNGILSGEPFLYPGPNENGELAANRQAALRDN